MIDSPTIRIVAQAVPPGPASVVGRLHAANVTTSTTVTCTLGQEGVGGTFDTVVQTVPQNIAKPFDLLGATTVTDTSAATEYVVLACQTSGGTPVERADEALITTVVGAVNP